MDKLSAQQMNETAFGICEQMDDLIKRTPEEARDAIVEALDKAHKAMLVAWVHIKDAAEIDRLRNMCVPVDHADIGVVAYARLIKPTPPQTVYRWAIDDCPYCHKFHIHGAGHDEAEVKAYLGHRTAHCRCRAGGEAGYQLVEAQP